MQTNRRGFLGIFGAGAIAGPKLAAGIAQGVAENSPMPPSGGFGLGGAVDSASSDGGSWRLKQIAQLKRIISGKDPQAAQQQVMHRLYMSDNRERVRLDGLRSVSPGHKMRMLVEGAQHRQQRISRVEAGFSLTRLLNGED